MINIGKYNLGTVIKERDFGYFLTFDGSEDEILLPNGSVIGDISVDDEIEVFLYRDSSDRPIATMKTPLVTASNLAMLEVVDMTNIGAFVSIGLERDVLLPLSEITYPLEKGKSYLLYLYVDKTGRLAVTTKIDKYLETDDEHNIATGDIIDGYVYKIAESQSAIVAIDKKYRGIILKNECYKDIKLGETLKLKVRNRYEDNMLSLTTRLKDPKGERTDLENIILDYLKNHNGFMKLNDKSSPDDIKATFNCSKNYFKNALGGLMKQRLISQDPSGTKLL